MYALERLEKITSQTPETPHEQAFQVSFGSQIKSAIAALKFPADPSKPDANWESVRQVKYKTEYVNLSIKLSLSLSHSSILSSGYEI